MAAQRGDTAEAAKTQTLHLQHGGVIQHGAVVAQQGDAAEATKTQTQGRYRFANLLFTHTASGERMDMTADDVYMRNPRNITRTYTDTGVTAKWSCYAVGAR